MQFDHIAEERQDHNFTHWVQALLADSPEHLAMQLAGAYLGQKRKQACQWKNGAFNMCYRVRVHDGELEAVIQFAALGRTIFRAEKVDNEVAVLQFLQKHTAIPVPEIYGSGKTWTGPYIIMSYVEGTPLVNILKEPKAEGRPVLNPQISEQGLRRAYHEMAWLLLELSKPEFPKIGALAASTNGEFTVAKRPFTFSMNELSTLANVPSHVFPKTVFESASDYFESLASRHMEKSMSNGLFWLCLAARHSQMFDEIYWTFLDEAHYGKFFSIEDHVEQHLDKKDHIKLSEIYQIKKMQTEDGKINSHYTVDDLMEL